MCTHTYPDYSLTFDLQVVYEILLHLSSDLWRVLFMHASWRGRFS
jgi:hypothetical protein